MFLQKKKKKCRLSSVLPWQPKRLNSTGRNWKRPNKGRMNRRLIGNFEAGWLVARKPIANYWAIGERSVAAWFSYTWALYCNWFVQKMVIFRITWRRLCVGFRILWSLQVHNPSLSGRSRFPTFLEQYLLIDWWMKLIEKFPTWPRFWFDLNATGLDRQIPWTNKYSDGISFSSQTANWLITNRFHSSSDCNF